MFAYPRLTYSSSEAEPQELQRHRETPASKSAPSRDVLEDQEQRQFSLAQADDQSDPVEPYNPQKHAGDVQRKTSLVLD